MTLFIGVLSPACAHAQAAGDKVWVELAGYWPGIASDIQATKTGDQSVGTEINAERDLGLEDRKILPSLHVGARLGRNWHANAEIYALKRHSRIALENEIIFEDVTYPANANVETGFDTDIYRLTVGRTLFRTKNLTAGAAIGVHATKVDVSLEGEGSVGSSPLGIQRRSENFLAPLPTVGLFIHFEPSPRIILSHNLDYLSLTVGDYDGRLINARVSAAYRFVKNAGAGIGYRYVNYRIGVDKERFSGQFDYRFSGPEAFVQLAF